MGRISVSIILIITLLTGSLFSQEKPTDISQLPKADPFKISTGKYFSASRGGNESTPVVTRQTINGRIEISKDFQEALAIIRKNHVDGEKVSHSDLTKASINSMLQMLDPHSNYFDREEYSELLSDQNSEYFGIGATIANFEKDGKFETYIVSTFPDSPAFLKGLGFGDKIVAVNNEDMTGKNSLYVRNKVRGKKGTVVRLKIERASSNSIETVAVRRNRVAYPSIPDAYILHRNVGYIDLSNGFNYTTNEELKIAIRELKNSGMNSLILDLRNNPGGILEQAVRVAETFLPCGKTIVSQKGRFVIDNRRWSSRNRIPLDIPLVVLVNDESASASEIVAGALQDYDRALIVGEKTSGKGLVQSILDLPSGAGLTLTTARYFTPSGRSIQRNYANGNLYDYFQHKVSLDSDESKLELKRTVNGRKVYGGDGITPDEIVKTTRLSDFQSDLIDSIFLFSRELAGGKVNGLENYKITGQIDSAKRIEPSDYPVTVRILDKFTKYALQNKKLRADKTKIEKESKFIAERIRYNLISARYGSVAAQQVLTENDPQVIKAVQLLPRAEQLARSSRKKY